MATRSAQYYEFPSTPERRRRLSAAERPRVSEPVELPMRRSRAGLVTVAILGALVGFGAIMLGSRTLDAPLLSESPAAPSREPSYAVSDAYVQALMASPPAYTSRNPVQAATTAPMEEADSGPVPYQAGNPGDGMSNAVMSGTSFDSQGPSEPSIGPRETSGAGRLADPSTVPSTPRADGTGVDGAAPPDDSATVSDVPAPLTDNPY